MYLPGEELGLKTVPSADNIDDNEQSEEFDDFDDNDGVNIEQEEEVEANDILEPVFACIGTKEMRRRIMMKSIRPFHCAAKQAHLVP